MRQQMYQNLFSWFEFSYLEDALLKNGLIILNFRAKIVIISQKWCIIYGLMQNKLSSLQQSQ